MPHRALLAAAAAVLPSACATRAPARARRPAPAALPAPVVGKAETGRDLLVDGAPPRGVPAAGIDRRIAQRKEA